MFFLETHNRNRWSPASRPVFALLVCLILSPAAIAQVTQPLPAPPESPAQQGTSLRLESLSLFTGYYSSGFDVANSQTINPNALSPDVMIGSSATIKWDRPTERSDVFMAYSAEYTGHLRYSDWQNLNHSFNLNVSRTLGRWDFHFSAAAALTTLENMLFEQNALANVASVKSSFDDLTAGIMRGTFQNRALAPVLSGVQAVASPTLLLYGARALTTAAQVAVTNHLSSRSSISVSVGGNRNEGLPLSNAVVAAGATPGLLSATTANVAVSMSHSLSPRTEVTVSFGTNRTVSRLQDAYFNSGNLAITHTLNEHWFAGVHGGGGNIVPVKQLQVSQTSLPYIAGGSLGYKTFAHTFLVAFDRTFVDSYGFGAGAMLTSNAAWNWTRAGGAWRLRASVSQQRIVNSAYATIDTWQATIGLRRLLSPHAALTAEYGYMRYSGVPPTTPSLLAETASPSAVRLVVSWAPGLSLVP